MNKRYLLLSIRDRLNIMWKKEFQGECNEIDLTAISEDIDVVVLEIDKENRRVSLGHKQLEENPWDVFESVFVEDSVHQGTVVTATEKGVVVSLPYGVEGFVPIRHAQKEDGGTAKVDEVLDFKVLEFSKDSKKIILSHSKIFRDVENAEKNKDRAEKQSKNKATNKAMKKINENVEKTTLGDLEGLANLKSDMEQQSKAAAESKAKADDAEEKAE